jgi:glutamate formiminotransferase
MAMLLAVPNLSEGRDLERVHRLVDTFLDPAALLDFHFDQVHNRTAVTIAGEPEALRRSLEAGARAAVAEIDMTAHEGEHPCIGAVDVCPTVYLREEDRMTARHEAAEVARWIGDELAVPVFLYGDLAATEERRERAYFREGGVERLAARMEAEQLAPDFGPIAPHPTAGATLVTARPPLAAFNVEIAAGLEHAKAIAAHVRETLPGVRALGLELARAGIVQVSTNIEDLAATTPGDVVAAVRARAPVTGAELVAPAPRAAFESFPRDIPLRGAPLIG